MHFSNGRFSNKETGFSGPYVVWSLLGAPGEKKKRKPNVFTRKSSSRKQILQISGKNCKICEHSEIFEFGAVQRIAILVNTFGFLFFSLQGLPEGSRPRTDPKIPFPYWKIDHLRNACPPIFCFDRRIRQNQRKSARDG